MGQIIISSWKRLFRNKFNMFWILLFPIALGTFFYIAFSNLGESENISTIPVAVVITDDEYGTALKETITAIEEKENPLFDASYCTEEEAKDLLKENDVAGILYSGEKVRLSVSANTSSDTINQSILEAFAEEYNQRYALISDVIKEHPENIKQVLSDFETERVYNEEVSLQKNPNVDTYTQYFYNQLAMACLYAAMAGVLIAVENQSNLSTLAARKVVSPKKKSIVIIGELFASTVFEFVMKFIGVLYLSYVLKVGVDAQFGFAILTLFVGVFTGVSLGFFFGTLGKKGADEKNGLIFAVVMPMCFFSGLMIGNMRIIIDEFAPVVNKLNPAALITDSFYCLSIFEGHERYTQNMITLLVLSVIFITLGIIKTRRARYASL